MATALICPSCGAPINQDAIRCEYWRDGLDKLYPGDWLTNPDPTWIPLEPVWQDRPASIGWF